MAKALAYFQKHFRASRHIFAGNSHQLECSGLPRHKPDEMLSDRAGCDAPGAYARTRSSNSFWLSLRRMLPFRLLSRCLRYELRAGTNIRVGVKTRIPKFPSHLLIFIWHLASCQCHLLNPRQSRQHLDLEHFITLIMSIKLISSTPSGLISISNRHLDHLICEGVMLKIVIG